MLKINKFNVFMILGIQTVILALFVPIYEFPDAMYHLSKIKDYERASSLYHKLQGILIGRDFNLNNFKNLKFSFGKNLPVNIYDEFVLNRLVLGQIFNLFLIFIFIFGLKQILKRNKKIDKTEKIKIEKITLIYFMWPQISYYITTLSSDFFVVLYQPFFIYFLKTKQWYSNLLCILFLIKYIDRNALSNLIFLLLYYFLYKLNLKINIKKIGKLKLKIFLLIEIIIIIIFVYVVINKTNLLKNWFPEVFKQVQYNYSIGSKSIIKRLLVVFLSSFYLSGSLSFRFPFIFYIIYAVTFFKLLFNSFCRKDKNSEILYLNFIVSFGTIIIVLLIIPTLGQLKYYCYIVLFFLEGLYSYTNLMKNKNYIIILFFTLNIFISLFVSTKSYFFF